MAELAIQSVRREARTEMSLAHRLGNLIAVVLPLVAFFVAIVLLWNRYVGWTDIAILVFMYSVSVLGITVGFHRLLTHRAFKTYAPVRWALAALGQLTVEGPVITWVADHRKHHAFADEEGDPHSPHVGYGGGVAGALRGLWHAHVGWLFNFEGRAEARRYAPDLMKDRGLRVVSALFGPVVLAGLLVPFGLGWALTGTLKGALTGMLWGGLVRIFLAHHMTFSINSVCHFFGRRRFETDDESRNVFWLALPSFGESWHHNHHAFPTSASHGMRWWEIDLGAWFIRGLERLGLAWDVVRISPERQAAKADPASRAS